MWQEKWLNGPCWQHGHAHCWIRRHRCLDSETKNMVVEGWISDFQPLLFEEWPVLWEVKVVGKTIPAVQVGAFCLDYYTFHSTSKRLDIQNGAIVVPVGCPSKKQAKSLGLTLPLAPPFPAEIGCFFIAGLRCRFCCLRVTWWRIRPRSSRMMTTCSGTQPSYATILVALPVFSLRPDGTRQYTTLVTPKLGEVGEFGLFHF